MKNQQHQAACQLYLSSDFTVTEIANHLGISRRSIQLWAKNENWSALKDYIGQHVEMQDFKSVRNMAFGMAFFNSMFRQKFIVSLSNYGELRTTSNKPETYQQPFSTKPLTINAKVRKKSHTSKRKSSTLRFSPF